MIITLDKLTPERLLDVLSDEVQEQINMGSKMEDLVFVGRVLNIRGIPDKEEKNLTLVENPS